jgi:hypothetical protein
VNLDLAAAVLFGDKNVSEEGDVLLCCQQSNPDGHLQPVGTKAGQLKTKVRRLYDIANILTSLGLICKVRSYDINIRKPAFRYTGPQVEAAYFSDQGKSIFFCLVCEAIGTAATPGLLCQPQVIVKTIVEKQMECRLARETKVLGENLPQRHFRSSQNPTCPDPGLNPGRRGGKPATNRLSYGAA